MRCARPAAHKTRVVNSTLPYYIPFRALTVSEVPNLLLMLPLVCRGEESVLARGVCVCDSLPHLIAAPALTHVAQHYISIASYIRGYMV